MKKVVILSAFLSPYRSGAEACVEEVAIKLSKYFDVTIVTSKKFSGEDKKLRGIVSIKRVGLGLSIDKWLFPIFAPFAVRKLRPDITHAILETFAGLTLHFCKYADKETKRILTLQTTNRSFLKGMIIRSADKVTAISKALVKIAGELGRNDVVLIPNGVNISQLCNSVSKTDGSILFVGRLEKMKGIDILMQAFKKVSEKNSEAKLRIVGDGSQRKTLKSLAYELGIKDKVTFTGKLSPNEVYEEYGHAQIFCGLSRSEAFGNVFIEAQAAGCAVVGTSIGGIPDTVEQGVTGLLVKPDDVDGAVEALERLLSDADLRNKLSENGRKNAEKYDWANIAQQYAELYS